MQDYDPHNEYCEYCEWARDSNGRACLDQLHRKSYYYCTREDGHTGAHVACGFSGIHDRGGPTMEHNVSSWQNGAAS